MLAEDQADGGRTWAPGAPDPAHPRADAESPDDDPGADGPSAGAAALPADLRQRAAAFAADVAAQGSEAAPDPRLRAILQHAERLARSPESVDEQALDALREQGLDDRAIHDLSQVIAYFSYINRIADGLGVDLEPDMDG